MTLSDAQSLQETQKLTSVSYVCPPVARPAQPERHKTGHQKIDIVSCIRPSGLFCCISERSLGRYGAKRRYIDDDRIKRVLSTFTKEGEG